jgi:hypothetical protein
VGIFALALLALLAIAGGAYVRLAPLDPALWDLDPAAAGDPGPAGAIRAPDRVYPLPPADLLARLTDIARADPNVTLLAGDPATGRVTLVHRSGLWRFPDVATFAATTAPDGARLTLRARSVYGGYDWGTNARRLDAWLAALAASLPPP